MAHTEAHAESSQKIQLLNELKKQLHPNFQWHLEQRENEGKITANAILQVQTLACLETLHHAILNQQWQRVSELLGQLTFINKDHCHKLYEFLWLECAPAPDNSDAQWGEKAFHRTEGFSATGKQMTKAVIQLQNYLKNR
jgi:hypothetical protein